MNRRGVLSQIDSQEELEAGALALGKSKLIPGLPEERRYDGEISGGNFEATAR